MSAGAIAAPNAVAASTMPFTRPTREWNQRETSTWLGRIVTPDMPKPSSNELPMYRAGVSTWANRYSATPWIRMPIVKSQRIG